VPTATARIDRRNRCQVRARRRWLWSSRMCRSRERPARVAPAAWRARQRGGGRRPWQEVLLQL